MSQYIHSGDFSTITQDNRGASIMGGPNEQASLISINNNGRNITSMRTHIRVGRVKSVTEPAPNTTGSNKDDTNVDTCCLVQNFIPIEYKKRSADIYPYSEAFEPIKNVNIVYGAA